RPRSRVFPYTTLFRSVASGGVTVRQGDRRGVAEQAEYIAAEGKFVLSGGHPTLYDTFRGTTTGRQLTFFFADDTIVVDSEEGSRSEEHTSELQSPCNL